VVPPWRRLYHWKTHDIAQNAIPWKTFFDVKSLNRYVPVIEFEDFVNETGSPGIDLTIYLQRYKEGWTNGEWEEKIDERECLDAPTYRYGQLSLGCFICLNNGLPLFSRRPW
jgi:peptide-O-fucosyltransferase